jgi:hypothetical protein
MDGVETAIGATLAVTIGLIWLASKALDRHIKRRTHRRFQRTARQAARTQGPLTDDEALAFEQIVAGFAHDIPHQIRRTEEP